MYVDSHGLAVGVDIIEIERVRRVLARYDRRFLTRVYTAEEAAFCRGRVAELAARFAAKEAVMKALGTGARGVAWREIEVLPDGRGKPLVYLYGGALRRAQELGLAALDVSLSHSKEYALAMVVANRNAVSSKELLHWRQRLVGRLRARGLL